jgi:hypothetical protein
MKTNTLIIKTHIRTSSQPLKNWYYVLYSTKHRPIFGSISKKHDASFYYKITVFFSNGLFLYC